MIKLCYTKYTVQLNLNLTKQACTLYSTQHVFHFTHVYACVCSEIDDIEALVETACVHTRYVHDDLYGHVCMSVMYMPNLVRMHIDMYMNCKQRMMVKNL